MDDLISKLSGIRSKYNCLDESEEPYYRVLSEAIEALSAQPDRSCKTCRYVDEFLGGVFLCRRLKESKRVQPDFCCKKWRCKQDE